MRLDRGVGIRNLERGTAAHKIVLHVDYDQRRPPEYIWIHRSPYNLQPFGERPRGLLNIC
jgi:hypothetical protein